MSSKVLLDTNVMLDLALARPEGFDAAAAIAEAVAYEKVVAYVCATSLKDLYYILSKAMGEKDARTYIKAVMDDFIICSVDYALCRQAADSDEPDFEEITLEAKNTSGAVLGEVINHNVQTLADTIAPPRDVASELRRSEHVTDLRRAIGINDKFLMIRDLFGGDAAAYEAAIGTLNGFDDFDECMIYIAENYAWNANSDGAKFLMELLERKFA